MSGAAPGAKIVSVRVCLFIAGCTAHALIEGMIYAAKQANVDVINMSIGGLPALNDGNNARAVLYDRLIEQYNVQMFISAGNSGAGLNTIGDPSVATKVMSVGSYITNDDLAGQLRLATRRTPTTCTPSRRAVRARTAAFKPQIIAPGSAISTIPMWQPAARCLAPTPCRRATRCSTAPRWPRRRRPAPPRCWSARPSRPGCSTSRTSCARR